MCVYKKDKNFDPEVSQIPQKGQNKQINDTYLICKYTPSYMQELKQLNVKLPSDLYTRILETGKSRKDVIVDALNMYFDANIHNQQQETQQNDNTSYALMVEQLQEKDKQISELHILLQTTMNQNLITAPEKDGKRPWWKLW